MSSTDESNAERSAVWASNLARVRERIAAASAISYRAADAVRVLAAVKYIDTAACVDLIHAGVVDLAENRADALVTKHDGTVLLKPSWHFIGRLQSRQVRDIAPRVGTIHTLCSESAAGRLVQLDDIPELFVQVNVADDPAKDGIAPADLERFLCALPEPLRVSGLMTMPPFADTAENSRSAFATLRELRDSVAPAVAGHHGLRALSMGTTQDFDVAVQEGATHVRLGRILYDGEE